MIRRSSEPMPKDLKRKTMVVVLLLLLMIMIMIITINKIRSQVLVYKFDSLVNRKRGR